MNLTPEYWSQVAKEPARPNTEAERMELVRDRDWSEWEIHRRFAGEVSNFVSWEVNGVWSFESLQYILVPKEVKLREFHAVTAVDGWNLIRRCNLIELPEGWNPPSPPGSKVLTGEQLMAIHKALSNSMMGQIAYQQVTEILK